MIPSLPPPTAIDISNSSPLMKPTNSVNPLNHTKTLREGGGSLKILQTTKYRPDHTQPLKSKTTSSFMKLMIILTPKNTTANS